MFDECLYDYSGLEPTEWLQKLRVADVGGFECCECGMEIGDGDSYEFVAANYEGEWRVYTTCEPCYRIRKSLFKSGDFTFGNLWKKIKEVYGLTPDGVTPMWKEEQGGVELDAHYASQLERLGFAGRQGSS